jgi:hypothetical protein
VQLVSVASRHTRVCHDAAEEVGGRRQRRGGLSPAAVSRQPRRRLVVAGPQATRSPQSGLKTKRPLYLSDFH